MEYVIAKIRDKIRIFEKSGKVQATNFLTPAEVLEALGVLKGFEYVVCGGFDDAERRIIIVGECVADISDFCSVLRIESVSKKELQHRAVLGSVLGLGIKREMIGDIIANGEICDIIVLSEMKECILSNLNKIGRDKVRVSEVGFGELLKVDSEKVCKNVSVASLRLDAVVSSAFGIAREKSSSLIDLEKVLVNYLPCLNHAKAVKADDLISVRGYGRVKVLEVLGETKKGRVRIKLEVY